MAENKDMRLLELEGKGGDIVEGFDHELILASTAIYRSVEDGISVGAGYADLVKELGLGHGRRQRLGVEEEHPLGLLHRPVLTMDLYR